MTSDIRLITGGVGVDDRGAVSFINQFDFSEVKRFYMVENHVQGFVRAWHGHKKEAKYVTAVTGAAIVAAVKIDNWDEPSKDLEIHRYVISARNPQILYIPAGYANGFMSLTADAKLIFYSTSTLEESKGDDIRFDSKYWNAWSIVER